MSASDALQAIGIINSHDVAKAAKAAGLSDVVISYRPLESGRAYQPAAWQVQRPGRRTDPEGHWRDYGHKTFTFYRASERATQLEAAKAWASERYGIKEWAKVPGLTGPGSIADWLPAEAVAYIRAALKEGRLVYDRTTNGGVKP